MRRATDLGCVPLLLADAGGHGQAEAAARALATRRFVGDVDRFVQALGA